MNSEITDMKGEGRWVCYDGECALCSGGARRFGRLLKRYSFELVPLQTPWVRDRLGLAPGAVPKEIVLLTGGRTFGGADACVEMARQVWWGKPFAAASRLPGVMPILRWVYAFIARNRYFGKVCPVPPRAKWRDWTALVVLLAAVLALHGWIAPWIFMWLVAAALFFGFKWLTWVRGRRAVWTIGRRSFAYLFGWIGMDATAFLDRNRRPPAPRGREAIMPSINVAAGMAALLSAANAPHWNGMVRGWVGMVGTILCLHFGVFALLAFAWRRAGVHAHPLMVDPWKAASLTDFWGRRWNTAFHLLAHDLVLRPAARRWGIAAGTTLVFVISGLVHDLIISLPAGTGYGLPTIYFLIQGAGLLFERTPLAKRLGMGRGVRGWFVTMLFVIVPVGWLFHAGFVRNVILPMLDALGALMKG